MAPPARSKRKDLINAAARLLWNASVDFINMVVTRKTLVAPFGDVATILADMGIEDPEFGVRFFTSLADLMVEVSAAPWSLCRGHQRSPESMRLCQR